MFDELLTVFANNLSASVLNEDELAQVKVSYEAFTEYQRRQRLKLFLSQPRSQALSSCGAKKEPGNEVVSQQGLLRVERARSTDVSFISSVQ